MTTRTSTKMPRLRLGNQRQYESALVHGTSTSAFHSHRQVETHKLPGIGTYIIDGPKDSNLSAREKCFRYQEIHRGVSRSKLKSLPDIPKRYDMKTLPVAKLREAHRTDRSPCDDTGREVTYAASDTGSNDEGRSKKQDPSWKLASQEELVSRSPIGRIVQSTADVTGFGVRKNKISSNPKSSKPREFTYLSTNLALSEPEPVVFKATERELESQAEYRKQLTFYLSQVLHSEGVTPQPDSKRDDAADNNDGEDKTSHTIPYDSVGHSSKHLDWESNVRLGDMLINTTPDLRKRLKLDSKFHSYKDSSPGMAKEHKLKKKHSSNDALCKHGGSTTSGDGSNVKDGAKKKSYSNHRENSHFSFQASPTNFKPSKSLGQAGARTRATVTITADSTNRVEIVHPDEDGEEYYYHYGNVDDDGGDDDDDDDDDVEDDKWIEVVNTRVVESGVYDRYANVKLPPSARTHQPKATEHKSSLPLHLSRSNTSVPARSISKNNSPFGAS